MELEKGLKKGLPVSKIPVVSKKQKVKIKKLKVIKASEEVPGRKISVKNTTNTDSNTAESFEPIVNKDVQQKINNNLKRRN